MRSFLRQLHALQSELKFTIIAEYLPGPRNVGADTLSRVTLDDQWRVSDALIRQLTTAYGNITIDRFATNSNTVCDRFNSYFIEPLSTGIDAFA